MSGFRDEEEFWTMRRAIQCWRDQYLDHERYLALLLRYHDEALELLEDDSPAAARLREGRVQLEQAKERRRLWYKAEEQSHKLAWRMRQDQLRAGRRGGGA